MGFALFQGMTNLTINGIVLLTLMFGGYNLIEGNMNAGNLMTFLATTQTIQRSLYHLSLLYGNYIKVASSLEQICLYLSLKSPDLSGKSFTEFKGNVQFHNVKFAYPKRPEIVVLNNFNLELEMGKINALCGTSGSGKSTIAKLISSLYELQEGFITIDNIDLKDIDKKWLRSELIGFISQEPILFCTTIKENIRYGKIDATDEEIIAAAKIANAHQFISNFPDGYNTIVGQQGTALSGGQRQRIAIARAIIKDPKILILDEATSALDSESELLIQEALNKIMKNRTVLVIAHRLSTIRNCDQIIVLENGQILETGNHEQLLKNKGKYYRLVNQLKDNKTDILD